LSLRRRSTSSCVRGFLKSSSTLLRDCRNNNNYSAISNSNIHTTFQKMSQQSSTGPLFSSTIRNNSNSNNDSLSPPKPDKATDEDVNSEIIGQEEEEEEEEGWSNYERLVRKLYMTNLFNPVKLGLENMDRVHKLLGSPMDQPDISVVHIAGSNGKGSVALKTANTLRRSGYKVGLFVSPHISSFRERIQINGQPITEAQVELHLQEIFDLCEREEIPATFFEVTTALAFRIFDKEDVEVVVLETGLGGRLDATNVIARPALSIITSIGLEHTRILGDTIEKIALEKGGIIKEGCPVLVGNNVPLEVLKQCAEEKKASEFYQCDDVMMGPLPEPTMVEGKETFEDYDVENSRISSAALILLQFQLTQQKLQREGGDVKLISSEEIVEGTKIRPPCRFEEMDIPTTVMSEDGSRIQKNVRVILDVAHNPQAMDYLLVKLRSTYPNSSDNVRLVVGMSSDKDLKYCTEIVLDHVSQQANKLHLVEASHPRAASISSILEANPKLVNESHYYDTTMTSQQTEEEEVVNVNEHGRDVSSVSKQVRLALELAAKNDELLVVCGSVFIMADAREELGIVEPRDSKVIAEVAGAGLRSSQENFGDGKKKK